MRKRMHACIKHGTNAKCIADDNAANLHDRGEDKIKRRLCGLRRGGDVSVEEADGVEAEVVEFVYDSDGECMFEGFGGESGAVWMEGEIFVGEKPVGYARVACGELHGVA